MGGFPVLFLGGEGGINLSERVDVVPRKHLRDPLDTLFAALGVDAELFPLFRFKRFQKAQIHFAQGLKNSQRHLWVAFGVVLRLSPLVLVEPADRRPPRPPTPPHPLPPPNLCSA